MSVWECECRRGEERGASSVMARGAVMPAWAGAAQRMSPPGVCCCLSTRVNQAMQRGGSGPAETGAEPDGAEEVLRCAVRRCAELLRKGNARDETTGRSSPAGFKRRRGAARALRARASWRVRDDASTSPPRYDAMHRVVNVGGVGQSGVRCDMRGSVMRCGQ